MFVAISRETFLICNKTIPQLIIYKQENPQILNINTTMP
jgi:hypothetical protein